MTNHQTRAGLFASASALLLIPLIAMQFTNEVNWSTFDFMVAGVLLYGTAISCDLALHRIKSKKTARIVCSGIVLLLVAVWIELAVGIF